jgi:voltage-gated potassium channel
MNLKQIVDDPESRHGKWFAILVQLLILVSIIDFSLDTMPDLEPHTRSVLSVIETVTVIFFTVEYLLRLYVAESKPRFLFSFFGIVDLLAIAPYYLGLAVDLRGVRGVRILRLFRILKFARYTRALTRIRKAFVAIKEPLIVYMITTLLLVYLASVGIYYFERDKQPEYFGSVFHAMWWSIATLTTVGYGDVVPVTLGGRIFTGLVLLFGIGVISVPSALMAAALVEQDSENQQA